MGIYVLSLRFHNWKLIGKLTNLKVRKWELYNLETDPGEKENVISTNQIIGNTMIQMINRHFWECNKISVQRSIINDEKKIEGLKQLKALGYVKIIYTWFQGSGLFSEFFLHYYNGQNIQKKVNYIYNNFPFECFAPTTYPYYP